jgi:hypothetical protein
MTPCPSRTRSVVDRGYSQATHDGHSGDDLRKHWSEKLQPQPCERAMPRPCGDHAPLLSPALEAAGADCQGCLCHRSPGRPSY